MSKGDTTKSESKDLGLVYGGCLIDDCIAPVILRSQLKEATTC
jgi:hypothetical protein